MWQQLQPAVVDPAEWLGELHPLVEQLGSTHGLVALGDVSASLRIPPVQDLSSLRSFLRDYHREILLPIEWPAIRRGFDHASRRELRELLALDRQLADEPILRPFARASCRVGRCELEKLRPLRDERIVRRYLEAVERLEANAWHTLVYGLTLALYSLPLRQGLLGYGVQTTRGFIDAASDSLRISETGRRALLQELCTDLPSSLELLLGRLAAA